MPACSRVISTGSALSASARASASLRPEVSQASVTSCTVPTSAVGRPPASRVATVPRTCTTRSSPPGRSMRWAMFRPARPSIRARRCAFSGARSSGCTSVSTRSSVKSSPKGMPKIRWACSDHSMRPLPTSSRQEPMLAARCTSSSRSLARRSCSLSACDWRCSSAMTRAASARPPSLMCGRSNSPSSGWRAMRMSRWLSPRRRRRLNQRRTTAVSNTPASSTASIAGQLRCGRPNATADVLPPLTKGRPSEGSSTSARRSRTRWGLGVGFMRARKPLDFATGTATWATVV